MGNGSVMATHCIRCNIVALEEIDEGRRLLIEDRLSDNKSLMIPPYQASIVLDDENLVSMSMPLSTYLSRSICSDLAHHVSYLLRRHNK